MNGRKIAVFLTALVAVGMCTWPASADEYRRQTIVNDSNTVANDLHIRFSNDVDKAKVRPKDQPPGRDADAAIPGTDRRRADWAPPDTFGTVAGGGRAYVDFQWSKYGAFIDEANSFFTDDGAKISGFKLHGGTMIITQFQYDADTKITNDKTVPQQYMGVQLWKDNDLASFDIDQYFMPTGVSVPGIPLDFILDPGQEMILPFGPTTPDTYLLVTAEVMTLGVPDDFGLMYAAAAVAPEEIMGDCDLSGCVDDDDLSLLLANWVYGDEWGEGDLNGSGNVDDDDLSLLLANWGAGCSIPGGGDPIPEPVTAVLLAMGASVLISRSSRARPMRRRTA